MVNSSKWIAALAAVVLCFFALPAHADKNVALNLDGAALDTTAVGMADSTQIFSTGIAARSYLRLQPNRPGRYAISITSFDGPDSAAVTLPDTSNADIWSFSGGTDANADTSSYKEGVPPTSVQAASYELAVEFAAEAAGKWGAPRARYIPLRNYATGEWLTARQIRIRIRSLSAGGVTTFINTRYKGFAW